MKRVLLFATLLFAPLAGHVQTAAAQTAPQYLVLKSSVTDGDGRITLGDVFENAGAASGVVLGYRQDATAVLDAAVVQQIAARNGVVWDNPRGLRRIIVAAGPETSSTPTPQRTAIAGAQNYAGWGVQAPVAGPAGPIVVRRSEMVAVTWTQNGLSLTLSGQVQKDAGIGDAVQIMNPTSKKLIDAVITGPGTAVAGQAALQIRSQTLVSSR